MRGSKLLVCLVALTFSGPAGGEAGGSGELVSVIVQFPRRAVTPAPPGPGQRAAARAVLVRSLRVHAARSQQRAVGLLARSGVRSYRQLWAINALAVTAPRSVIDALRALPEVEAVRPDVRVFAPKTSKTPPGDPAWNLQLVGAPELWGRGFTGQGVVVATLDSGVDAGSAALAGNWRGGPGGWFDPNGEHDAPYDAAGHGTQVMSLLAGGALGGAPVGVAPGAQWIAVKIFDDRGTATLGGIHAGFQWLLDPDGDPGTDDGADVVANAWGFDDLVNDCFTEFEADIAALRAAGVAVVFAAGNAGPRTLTSCPPASNPGALAVGAVDESTTVADFSSRGPSACTGDTFPELTAPGVNVRAADLTFGGLLPEATTWVNGTSFAAPHVAGAVALLWSAAPGATLTELESALLASAMDAGAAGADDAYGFGVVDAAAALTALEQAGDEPPPPDPPSCTDDDGDGFFAEEGCGTALDCAPLDPTIHPGACDVPRDGIDQDCDGKDRRGGKACP